MTPTQNCTNKIKFISNSFKVKIHKLQCVHVFFMFFNIFLDDHSYGLID